VDAHGGESPEAAPIESAADIGRVCRCEVREGGARSKFSDAKSGGRTRGSIVGEHARRPSPPASARPSPMWEAHPQHQRASEAVGSTRPAPHPTNSQTESLPLTYIPPPTQREVTRGNVQSSTEVVNRRPCGAKSGPASFAWCRGRKRCEYTPPLFPTTLPTNHRRVQGPPDSEISGPPRQAKHEARMPLRGNYPRTPVPVWSSRNRTADGGTLRGLNPGMEPESAARPKIPKSPKPSAVLFF